MRTLILGGTQMVGRAIADYSVALGDEVTLVNRGRTPAPAGVRSLVADRLQAGALANAVAGAGDWDLVFDTWSYAPRAVTEAGSALAGRIGHFCYISTRSVYQWPMPAGADEWTPTVDGDPDSTQSVDYAADKRGSEFAAIRAFADHCLIARPGLILGPHENIGRLPYWLNRAARGGKILAPGHPDRPLQYIDARDLARFVRDLAGRGVSDIFDTVSQPGHATMGQLLGAVDQVVPANDRQWHWVAEDKLVAAEITGWVDLPIWTPESTELACLHNSNVTKAYDAGLACRPILETVADTWAWLSAATEAVAQIRTDGQLTPQRESELLALAD